jgi:AbrB family looped-hinge helix DNA binding protein
MAKDTSKLQITIPKSIATQFGIRPGDELAFVEAGDSIRLIPSSSVAGPVDVATRLELFDLATGRQAQRQRPGSRKRSSRTRSRDWTRDDLYERGRTR